MKWHIISVGKAHDTLFAKGIEEFTDRISRYYKIQWQIIAPPKNAAALQEESLKKEEAQLILKQLQENDFVILLDERGKIISSTELAQQLEPNQLGRYQRVVFIIGGAFGVDTSVQKMANFTWSLSKLVFPHMLVRLILAEQLYRACSIQRNEKYHHL
jgi:23S rRNA (pseudouridine1915-N3)-methyltransferase